MFKKFQQIITFATLLSFTGIVIGKQEKTPAIPDAQLNQSKFREGFDKDVNVSGGIIMGLALSKGTGLKSLNELYIDRSGLDNEKVFCLRSSSSDGVFWAENAFTVKGSQPIWRISPVSQKFKSRLKKYGMDHVVSVASFVSDNKTPACESSTYIYAPIIELSESATQTLTVFINSSGRTTTIELVVPQNSFSKSHSIKGDCNTTKLDGTVAYDRTCSIDLTSLKVGGVMELRGLFKTPPFDSQKWSVKVALPNRKP